MGDGIRYKYVEDSARAHGANFTRHLRGWFWGYGGPEDAVAPYMPLREIQNFYDCADRQGADEVERENKADFGRALRDIQRILAQQSSLSPGLG